MKRIVCLCIMAALCLCFLLPEKAQAVETSGTCGENATWSFDEATGTLTISGSGAMYNWSKNEMNEWFDLANRIKHIVVDEGITTIGDGAFARCGALETISLPSTLTSIGAWSFDNCRRLAQIDIPESVVAIGASAFYNCVSLKEFVFPKGVEVVEYNVLENVGNIDRLVIPSNIKEIRSQALKGCYSLTLVEFQGDAPIIGKDAFKDVAFTALYPADNSTWTEDVFQNYEGLIGWYPSNNDSYGGTFGRYNFTWSMKDGVLTITGDGYMDGWTSPDNPNPPWYSVRGLIEEVVLQGNITNIYAKAFSGCNHLKKVSIPDGLTVIFGHAFSGCTELEEIILPDTVTDIGSFAFSGCKSLKKMVFPASVVSVANQIFEGSTSMTGVYFLGDMPKFTTRVITESYITVYYPAGNSTWSDEAIEKIKGVSFGAEVSFVALECEHAVEKIVAKAPSCTQTGLTEGSRCSKCKIVLQAQEEIPATGHTFGEWETVNSSEEGVLVERSCETCGHTEQKLLDESYPPQTDPSDAPTNPEDTPAEPTDPPTEPTQVPTDAPTEPTQLPTDPTQPDITVKEESKTFPWVIIVIAVAAIGAAVGGVILGKKRK